MSHPSPALAILDAEGLRRFEQLQADAVGAVTQRFYATHGSAYERFGPSGRDACRNDLMFHLEFLRPVLEYGVLAPMAEYLRWLGSVLAARSIPDEHLGISLDWLGEFYAAHLPAPDADVVSQALHAARTQYQQAGEPLPACPPIDGWPQAAELEAALLAGNQREAAGIVNRAMDSGHTLVDVEQFVIQPAMYRIGERWQANEVTVAQEHLASAIAHSLMTMGLLRSTPPAAARKTVLLACAEGNQHAMGLRMVADAFELAGWEVQYLGANVPSIALARQVMQWQPDLVGLSVSFPQQLKGVRASIERLRELMGSARPPVVLGGLAINQFERLARAVGADASFADARTAVANASLILRDREHLGSGSP